LLGSQHPETGNNTFGIEPIFPPQQILRTMLNKAIGKAYPANPLHWHAHIGKNLQDSTPKSPYF